MSHCTCKSKSYYYISALFPRFIVSDTPVIPQFILLGAIAILADVMLFVAYAMAGSLIKAIDMVTGCLVVFIAIRILYGVF